MASTRSEIRTKLRNELKVDPNWKIWSDTILNDFIDTSYLQIQQDWNLDWQENDANTTYTPAAQETALPTDFWKVVLVRYNWNELIPTTKIDLKRIYNTFVSWTPYKYYIYSNKLWTDTITTSWTIDLDYKKINPWFTWDSDTSDYPVDFDSAIVKYWAYLAWSGPRGNENAATAKLQEYNLNLKRLRSLYIFNDVNNLNFWTARQAWTYRFDAIYF